MKPKFKFDFSGYATKNNIRCSDGRTIRRDAFKENDGSIVPLVWQHSHNDPNNVLGHALLENRQDGVYCYCNFNGTPSGKHAKELVQHGDITALSIYANQLRQNGSDVLHGEIKEVSIVLAGANPGALIENVSMAHADGSYTDIEDEAIIYSGLNVIAHSYDDDEDEEDYEDEEDEEMNDENLQHADGKTIKDVFDTLNEEQKTAVYAMLAYAAQGGEEEDEEFGHSDEGGEYMKRNVFDNEENIKSKILSHAQFETILADAKECGSLKDAILAHTDEYGIVDVDQLFPNAKALSNDPEWIKREDEWVAGVLAAVSKSPFSRVKTHFVNMNFDEARAKGYVKATEKKEVYLTNSKRVVTPTTIYVKQKLDRDDIIDVTDFDIVAMVRKELRILLDEEIARAIIIGDGRDAEDTDKISETNIIPIYNDTEFFAERTNITTKTNYKQMVKEMALAHKAYKGSGQPVLFTTPDIHTNMLWIEDLNGRRIYESDETLCSALRVSKIVEIPQLDSMSRTDNAGKVHELIGIKVNLKDYRVGTDKGGEIANFDDFDIDFNQYKYLMETRMSGALTKYKGAQIFEHEVAGNATPSEPEDGEQLG